MNLPEKIKITEVGPRDGLQNESIILRTSEKRLLIMTLIESGLTNIEVTAFVHPKLIPQLADSELLLDMLPWDNNLSYSALIPNLKGFERAKKTKLKDVTYVISASEAHNKANVGCSIQDSLAQLKEICRISIDSGIRVKGEISVSFGCPFEGEVSIKKLLSIANSLYESGCKEIVLADTIGIATPKQVYDIFSLIKKDFPDLIMAAHFHDTNRMALANILASMQAGITAFDTSIGGLGGCPFAPGATGNVSTENLVFMLDKMNINTGINIMQLLRSIFLIEKLLKKDMDLIPALKK
jgi:hydroxymethylglutaryl-CoA lyase